MAFPWLTPALVLFQAVQGDDFEQWKRMSALSIKSYGCRAAKKQVVVDGKLDDTEWRLAPWSEAFEDIEGPSRPKPAFQTRMKMLWDQQYFYIAAEMEEPHVWANITKRDAVIFQDNDFEIFIDPDADNHQYYEFEINALNTGWDLRLDKPYMDGGRAIDAWNIAGLKTAVHVDGSLNNPADRDRSWSVEIAVPWKALGEFTSVRAPPNPGDFWRFNASRVEWTVDVRDGRYQKRAGLKENNWVWSPQGVIDMHRPERWGVVQFLDSDGVLLKDETLAIRDSLHAAYYWQRMEKAKSGAYARELPRLNALELPANPTKANTAEFTRTSTGYSYSILQPRGDGGANRWTIDSSRKVGVERLPAK